MALNFDTNAYYQVNKDKRNAQTQNTYAPLQSANEAAQSIGGIGQDLQAMKAREQQQKMAQFLMQQKQQQQGQNQQKFNSDYGQPIDPNQTDVSQQAQPMLGKSSFMPGGQGQVASPSPLIDRFKQWQTQGMPKQTAESSFMPALSKDERQQYQKSFAQPKTTDSLNYDQAKLIVPTLDQKSFNAAYPQGIPKEHLAMMSKPQALSTMNTSTYATAPEDDQRLARNLVDGKIRPSDIGFRDRGRIVSLASEYADSVNKPFQSFGGDVNAGMAKNLAYGKMGQNVLSLNTALGHIGDASKAYDQLQNTNQQWLNVPLNKLKRSTNDPSIVALDLKLNAVAGEMATTFKSGGATDQEIGHFANVLNDNLTPLQAHAALQSAGELLNSRLNALQNQQSSVRGSNGGQRDLLSPHGSNVMNQLNSHPQDSEAVQWAKQNPHDPRAQKIMQLNGGQ